MKQQIWIIVIGLALFMAACGRTSDGIKVPGLVNGDVASVKTLVGGTVDTINFKEGDRVAKGAVFAQLNPDKIATTLAGIAISEKEIANNEERTRQKMAFLKADIDYLGKQVDKFTRLRASQAVSGDQLEKMKLQLLEAQTSFHDLEKNLVSLQNQKASLLNSRQSLELNRQDFSLRAPAEGPVQEIFVQAGETVLPGTNIADILNQASLYIEVFVEETELAGLKLNDPVTILTDSASNRRYTGHIRFFNRKAEFSPKYIVSEKERQALLYQVKISIDSDWDAFKIGMPVTVVIARTGR
jgi:HlyD family secretion protein